MERKPRAFVLDNFDSFTWNIAHALVVAGTGVTVSRVDATRLEDIEAARPDLLVISPGPGKPEDSFLSLDAISRFSGRVPIFGVCLGMQCIAVAFGGMVAPSGNPIHGKVSAVEHDGEGLFEGLPSPLEVGRYHSLRVTGVPSCLAVTARTTEDGTVMGLKHRTLPVFGVQFHPDSFLTPSGPEMFKNAVRGLR